MRLIPPDLLRDRVKVLVVGCGGTGSVVAGALPYLHNALVAAGHPRGIEVRIMDDDLVSIANCVRQPFGHHEVGYPKAVVTVNRINVFWGLQWEAEVRRFTRHMLRNPNGRYTNSKPDIVIGCVDSRAARREIHEGCFFEGSGVHYWLDFGNTADGGQFVLGEPVNKHNPPARSRLRCVSELWPDVIDASLDKRDTYPSCSAAEALERQEPFINQALAYQGMAMLARLFRKGRLEYHGAFWSAAMGRMAPLSTDPDAAERSRRLRKKASAA